MEDKNLMKPFIKQFSGRENIEKRFFIFERISDVLGIA